MALAEPDHHPPEGILPGNSHRRSLMHFYSGPPMQNLSGVDTSRLQPGLPARPQPRPSPSCSSSSAGSTRRAQVHHLRQRHRLRPAWPAPNHARHDNMVLRQPMPPGKRAASKTPMADYDAGCRAISISTASRTRRIQGITLTVNLTPRKCLGFKTPFQASSPSLAKTSKSASHETVAVRSGIQVPADRNCLFEPAGGPRPLDVGAVSRCVGQADRT